MWCNVLILVHDEYVTEKAHATLLPPQRVTCATYNQYCIHQHENIQYKKVIFAKYNLSLNICVECKMWKKSCVWRLRRYCLFNNLHPRGHLFLWYCHRKYLSQGHITLKHDGEPQGAFYSVKNSKSRMRPSCAIWVIWYLRAGYLLWGRWCLPPSALKTGVERSHVDGFLDAPGGLVIFLVLGEIYIIISRHTLSWFIS